MRKKAVQQGRSERRGEAYSVPYVEPLNDARTPLAGFFRILLEKVYDLSHVLFISIFSTGNISTPVTRIPQFNAVVEANQYDLLILIHWDQLS